MANPLRLNRFPRRFTAGRLNRRQRFAALILALVAACFITLDLSGGSFESAHTGVRGSLGALYRGTDNVLGPARRWLQGLPSAGSNQVKIDGLEHENTQLRGQLAREQNRAADAAAIAKLGSLSLGPLITARVVAIGAGQGFDWTVTLDKGTEDGISLGQTVTDGAGLVGRILHADKTSSVVLLAADPGSGVGSRDGRSGEIGIVTGAGAEGFTFRPLNPEAKLKVGDHLVTGPSQDTSYVPGLAIGTIRSVTSSTDGTLTAHVDAASSPTSLDILGVITTAPPSATSSATP